MSSEKFIGFHYDIARGAYLKPEFFCKAMQLAAKCGYTHFLPYLENMIRLPSMRRACPPCAYDEKDWRLFDAAAAAAGIELVPHFNVIGHTAPICEAYPELAGESRGESLDVELEVTQKWMLRCLDEYCQFSTGKHFLIGGDEWQPPRHLLARTGFDAGRAWAAHINRAVAFLQMKERRPIVWHDMLLHYPSALALLSREAIIAFWFYDQDADYPALSMFKEMGFATLMASGLCDGLLETRRCRAVHAAIAAAKKHDADGFMITTWSDGRWEKQQFNIAAVAGMLRGEDPPTPILQTLSLMSGQDRLPTDSALARRWQDNLDTLIDDPAWLNYPDLQRSRHALISGDTSDDVTSYLRFHTDEGPLYEQIRRGRRPATSRDDIRPPQPEPSAEAFALQIGEDPKIGPVLRFINGKESFEIYPRYGATLQKWWHGSTEIIPSTIGSMFGALAPLPGGYLSFVRAGGFRPIWGMGAHSNPCILWHHPFDWSVVRSDGQQISVRLALDLEHVSVTYEVTIDRDRSGFDFVATAVNRLPGAYGAFNFNLPLSRDIRDLSAGELSWSDESGAKRSTTVERERLTAFWIPASSTLNVGVGAGMVRIDAEPEQTAGYFVDWGARFITPDVHGIYRKLVADQKTIARWRFAFHELDANDAASK